MLLQSQVEEHNYGDESDGSRETDLHIVSENNVEDIQALFFMVLMVFSSVDKKLKIEGISLANKTFTGPIK